MKYFLSLIIFLCAGVLARAQIRVPYPCTEYKTDTIPVYDSTLLSARTVDYDTSYKQKCKTTWFFFKSCKTTMVIDSTVSYKYWWNVDTSLEIKTTSYPSTCYRDSFPAKLGVIINSQTLVADEKADITADSLQCNAVRTSIMIQSFEQRGFDKLTEAYQAKGLDLVLNINYSMPGVNNGDPAPFVQTATEMDNYKKQFAAITDKYPAALIVAENEPLNSNEHIVDVNAYINQLKEASAIAHAKGLKIADGGVYGNGLECLIWRWLNDNKRYAARDSFAVCMESAQVKNAATPGRNATMEQNASDVYAILQADKIYSDYANVHVYEDTTKSTQTVNAVGVFLTYAQQYIKATTGLEMITNEIGQRNNIDPSVVTGLMNKVKSLNIPVVIWFCGDDGSAGARALINADGSLRDNGKAFKKCMK